MEAGHPGTAMVQLARALQVFGELEKLNQLLDTPEDTIGLMLTNICIIKQKVRPYNQP